MHYKKRKLHKLHSIPIGLCNKVNHKRLYLVSYSIPLSCMVVLLLGFSVMVDPNSAPKTNAVEISKTKTASSDTSVTPREAVSPSVTFSIGGAGQNEVVETGVDEVAYRSHMIKVNLNNVDEYFMYISGNTNLTTAAGGAELTGTGDTGVPGSEIPAGQWGYGWDYTGAATDEGLTYKTVPATQTKLTVPELVDNAASFNGKLSFAAKFPNNATLGNYTSNVRLTLIASPKAQTGSALWRNELGKETNLEAGTETMQGIQPGFCKGNPGVKEGWTVDLVDTRDKKTYTVYKAADGNCWMGQNLELTGPMTLASGDSDLPEGMTWELPASVGSGGKNENNVNSSDTWDIKNNNVVQIRTGSDSPDWKDGFGNYYSWPAATAGTGTTSTAGTDASASICPKGWRLPSNTGNGSYLNLTNAYSSGWLTNQQFNGLSNISGARLGFDGTSVYNQANFWPAAGYINQASGTVSGINSNGRYWSRTAHSEVGAVYHLDFAGWGVRPQITFNSYFGLSVRCVADETF